MCGIAGVFGEISQDESMDAVARMNRAMAHRGPDDNGSWSCDSGSFGMRRLSIIDLDGGRQPIFSEEGVGTVFNGEIYNYLEIREELKGLGHSFQTRSDTEVALRSFLQWGEDCVTRFNGMFAIAIYDPREGRLWLFRDRLGIKPLYYVKKFGCFWFSSEIKSLIAGLGEKPSIHLPSIHQFLTFRFVPDGYCAFEGVNKLSPGSRLCVDLNRLEVSRQSYWQSEVQSEPLDESRDYLKEFEELFLDAVEKRLVASDVPVGVLLSGGLDSSAVAAAAIELGHKSFHTFTVHFEDGGEFSEMKYAKEMALQLGCESHDICVTQKDFLDTLTKLPHDTDEPLADLASIPLYHVSKLARREVKVVLAGEGADEILCGYSWEQIAQRLHRLSLLARIPSPLLNLLAPLCGDRRKNIQAIARRGLSGYLQEIASHMTWVFDENEKRELWRSHPPGASSNEVLNAAYEACDSHDALDQLQQIHIRSWLVEDLLMKGDRMSMANSLELRVPFLDHRLVEWASHLPQFWKVGSPAKWESKRILRSFAEKRVPASILYRPKRGFPVPAYRWLTEGLAGWAEDLLTGAGSKSRDLFSTEMMRGIVKASARGDSRAAHQAWNLIVLEYWLRTWT